MPMVSKALVQKWASLMEKLTYISDSEEEGVPDTHSLCMLAKRVYGVQHAHTHTLIMIRKFLLSELEVDCVNVEIDAEVRMRRAHALQQTVHEHSPLLRIQRAELSLFLRRHVLVVLAAHNLHPVRQRDSWVGVATAARAVELAGVLNGVGTRDALLHFERMKTERVGVYL